MKTLRTLQSLFLLILMSSVVLTGCNRDDDDPDDVGNDPEVITSVTITFTNTDDASDVRSFSFKDPDGDGGNAPTVFDNIVLPAGEVYNGTLSLLDESGDTVEDITTEVQEEGNEHLLCYTVSTADVQIVRADSDGTFPIGLSTQWTTGAAGNGTVQIVLKHQPDGEKDGSCEPGDTDVDLTFQVEIQ